MSDATPGRDSVRDLARQRQPYLRGPAQTPSWVGPDRHPERRAPRVPDQALPDHDRIEDLLVPAPTTPEPGVLEEAHWSGQGTGRLALSLMLIAAATGTLVALALTVRTPDRDHWSMLAIAALATVGLFAIMATTRPMEVHLQGSVLTVHHRDTVDTFDLADPFQPVVVRGTLDSPTWSLSLGKIDGGTVVISHRTVRAAELHPVVIHQRTRADALRRARDERFGL